MESIMTAVLKEEKNIKLIVNGVNNGSCFKGTRYFLDKGKIKRLRQFIIITVKNGVNSQRCRKTRYFSFEKILRWNLF